MTKKGKIWLFAIIAAVVVAIVAIAVFGVKDDPVLEPTLDEYVREDFADAQNAAEALGETAFFYEVHVTLNGTPARTDEDELKPIFIESVWQIADTCTQKRRDVLTGAVDYEKVNDYWMGSTAFDPTTFELTFADAVRRLHEANNIIIPDGDKMTIRQPVSPKWKTPMYIFGTGRTGFVYVDAITGEVGKIE